MTTEAFDPLQRSCSAPRGADAELETLTVPYAGQTRMRLTIVGGIAGARIRIERDAKHLIAIEYGEDFPPRLRVSSSELRLSWRTTLWSWLLAALSGAEREVEIVLHPAVEWTFDLRGGVSGFEADLAAGKLARLEIGGGVSDVHFALPAATALVPIRIAGGACDLDLQRPQGTGVSLDVRGGISGLRLDEQAFDAIGGGARLAAGALDGPRYALEISGGASGLAICTER